MNNTEIAQHLVDLARRAGAEQCDVFLNAYDESEVTVRLGNTDRVIEAGGFVSVNTGGAPDGNSLPVAKVDAERAMDAAACIGCGACVAACPNASAMLFLSAKVSHLAQLPQGQPERKDRVRSMVLAHDREGFGHCTNINECEAACPKEISIDFIAYMNRDYAKAQIKNRRLLSQR